MTHVDHPVVGSGVRQQPRLQAPRVGGRDSGGRFAYDKVDDGRPRVAVVDVVTEAGRVNDCELDLELLLLQFGFDDVCGIEDALASNPDGSEGGGGGCASACAYLQE